MTFAEGSRLETIGRYCFAGSGIEEIVIPGSVTTICANAFWCCAALKWIQFQEDGKLERLGRWCLGGSGLVEVEIPRTVKTVGANAFHGCSDLKFIYMEDGCECSLAQADVPPSAKVLPPRGTAV